MVSQADNTENPPGGGIQLKLLLFYAVLLMVVLVLAAWLLAGSVREQIEEGAERAIHDSGELLVAELMRRTTMVNGLAQGLAQFAETAPHDSEVLNHTLPAMLNLPRASAWIAGGGYWPEPFAFDPARERSSFFWGRDRTGNLKRYENYNIATGPGYHRREWYVPARYLAPGKCYWSRAYVDPYSREPMVTCTVSVAGERGFAGAVTVDLRLAGLSAAFERKSAGLDGYAFALDQHNNFITMPQILPLGIASAEEAVSFDALAARDERYRALAQALRQINDATTSAFKNSAAYPRRVVAEMAQGSDEISAAEADVIALALRDFAVPDSVSRAVIEADPVLGEAGVATIFMVPESFWRVVVITPQAMAVAKTQSLVWGTILQLVLPVALVMVLAFFVLRRIVITPLRVITSSLQRPGGHRELRRMRDELRDEFGQLAYWFSRRSEELREANAKLEEVNAELEFQANFDFVTRLYNRRHFERDLDALAETEVWSRHALMLISIDQFRIVNDTSGHAAGDAVLVQMANLLRTLASAEDHLARLGGNEFAVMITSPNIKHAVASAERFRQAISDHPFVWEGRVMTITASLGVVHLGDVQRDRALALRLLDGYCHLAKEAGRNCVRNFEADDATVTQRHDEMGVFYKLQEALALDHFFVEFQLIEPIQGNPDHGKPAMEALVRMREPDGTVLYPGSFLPAAERYNAIEQIDRWVIENTMITMAGNRAILEAIDFCSINLSGDSLVQQSLVLFIKELLQRFRLPANKFCFEITETQVISNLERARMILGELGDRGCRLALDDFGSGMSSFGYLRDLPVDIIKIDGRFVRDICTDVVDHAFVKSIGDVAQAMNLQTIAEFVETDTSLAALENIGIDFAQGYYLGRPTSIEEVLKQRVVRHPRIEADEPDSYRGK